MNTETRSERVSHLDWPFFEGQHRTLARELDAWATEHVAHAHGDNVDAECRALVRSLGDAGWLRHAVGGTAFGGVADVIDTRAICVIRETLDETPGFASTGCGWLGEDGASRM